MTPQKAKGQDILEKLRQRGIHLTVEPGGLRVHGGKLPAHVVRCIQQNRESVLQALHDQEADQWPSERILSVYDRLLK